MPKRLDNILRTKRCQQCDALIHWQPRHGRKAWANARFCSNICVGLARRGNQSESFAKRISPDPNTGCWYWMGADKGGQGYGQFLHGPLKMMAHVYAYRTFVGPVPDGLFVCHRCDVPPCVNPQHLFLGTHMDNVLDCMTKRRHGLGERNGGGGKLKAADIHAIRALYVRGHCQVDIADKYAISQVMVSRIVLGKSWGHVA